MQTMDGPIGPEGRRVLNFSDWDRGSSEAGEAGESVREREMPPRSYVLLHPEARSTGSVRDRVEVVRQVGIDHIASAVLRHVKEHATQHHLRAEVRTKPILLVREVGLEDRAHHQRHGGAAPDRGKS